MNRILVLALLIVGFALPASAQTESQQEAAVPADTVTGVRLQGLDKITARIFAFDAPMNQTVRFGYLEITARACEVSAEEDIPERTAFLQIAEHKPERDPVQVFSGWMFASSPSVSAMEHAVYDVWVVDCIRPGLEDVATTEAEVPAAADDVEAPVEGVERPLD